MAAGNPCMNGRRPVRQRKPCTSNALHRGLILPDMRKAGSGSPGIGSQWVGTWAAIRRSTHRCAAASLKLATWSMLYRPRSRRNRSLSSLQIGPAGVSGQLISVDETDDGRTRARTPLSLDEFRMPRPRPLSAIFQLLCPATTSIGTAWTLQAPGWQSAAIATVARSCRLHSLARRICRSPTIQALSHGAGATSDDQLAHAASQKLCQCPVETKDRLAKAALSG